VKQAIIVRAELKMPKGKLAAQVAHGSIEAASAADPRKVAQWRAEGGKKVVLKVQSLAELKKVFKEADSMGLPAAIITDAASTFFSKPTVTCCGIGPSPDHIIDDITGKLALL
jgi:peptidyl-tRNA hydrolase, PTH2 family